MVGQVRWGGLEMSKAASLRRSAPVVPDRWLVVLLLVLVAGVAGVYLFAGTGEQHGLRPGDPAGHLIGVAGALLMGAGLLFPLVKRTTPLASLKPWWHQGHLLLGALGAAMAFVHLSARLGKAPTLVALAVLALLLLGAYGRLLAGRLVHTTFAGDHLVFLPADPTRMDGLPVVRARKEKLLAKLDPRAVEATFTLTLWHWIRHPLASTGYARLALEEERLVGRRRKGSTGLVVLIQRNWRLLHLVMVGLMLLGVLAHSVMVLFFAGYVAEGVEPYWWYLRK